MHLIQHKKEALWFYRFVPGLRPLGQSALLDAPASSAALRLARFEHPGLRTLDVGAGTGFSTEGIVEQVDPAAVTMLDQSPDQLRRARRKPQLAGCTKVLGDAERLPFETTRSTATSLAGASSTWPDPARAVAEAHRVVRPGGTALIVGPSRHGAGWPGWWPRPGCSFPRRPSTAAGSRRRASRRSRPPAHAPWGQGDGDPRYGLAIAGRASPAGPAAPAGTGEDVREPWTPRRLARFWRVAGRRRVRAGGARHAPARPASRRRLTMPGG